MTFDDAAGNDFAVMYVVTQYQKKIVQFWRQVYINFLYAKSMLPGDVSPL